MMKIFVTILLLVSYTALAFGPPQQIQNNMNHMKIIRVTTGKLASDEIFKLHGKKFPLKDAYVAEYKSDTHYLVVWASKSKTEKDAKELIEAMNKKIPLSKAFRYVNKINVDNIEVFYVIGMGMDNYYFLKGDENYWVAITGDYSLELLKKFIIEVN